jgi:hypothetical protein
VAGPYNGFMTTIHDHSAASVVPQSARAGWFLECLTAQDFAQPGGAPAPDVRLRALLPLGLRGVDRGRGDRRPLGKPPAGRAYWPIGRRSPSRKEILP